MNVTIRGAVTHLCPFKDERDYGTVVIWYDWLGGQPLELQSVREALDSFANRAITHEEMTAALEADFISYGATVMTTWQTAGLEVEIG